MSIFPGPYHPLSLNAKFEEMDEMGKMFERARQHVMTPKERYEQRVSWLMGMTGKLSDPMPTRERIVKALLDMGYADPEPSEASTQSKGHP